MGERPGIKNVKRSHAFQINLPDVRIKTAKHRTNSTILKSKGFTTRFMLQFITIFSLLLQVQQGYVLNQKDITFIYPSNDPNLTVFVSGNFTGWSKTDPRWQARYDANSRTYRLTKRIDSVKNDRMSFYEFSYVVDGDRLDADPKAPNSIHCAGHGYRYVIHW